MHILRLTIANIRAIDELKLDLTASGDNARRRVIILGGNGSGKTTILSTISHLFADEINGRSPVRLDAGDVRMNPASQPASAATERLDEPPFGTLSMDVCMTSQERSEVAHRDWARDIPPTFSLQRIIGERSAIMASLQKFVQQLSDEGRLDDAAKKVDLTKKADKPIIKAKQILQAVSTPACVLLPADRGTLSDFENVSVGSLSEFDPQNDCLTNDRSRFRILPNLLALAFVAPKRNDPDGLIARMWKVIGKYFPEMPKPVDIHGLRMLFETPDGTIVTLSQLSDGQRALLLIMSDLALRNPAHGVVLIDEIEQHLHPRWQQAILDALAALLPDAQFIITSQAPYVAASAPDDVITIGDWRRDGPQ